MAGRLRKRQKLSFNAHNQNPKSKIQNPSHKRAGDKKARQRNITNNTKTKGTPEQHEERIRNTGNTRKQDQTVWQRVSKLNSWWGEVGWGEHRNSQEGDRNTGNTAEQEVESDIKTQDDLTTELTGNQLTNSLKLQQTTEGVTNVLTLWVLLTIRCQIWGVPL